MYEFEELRLITTTLGHLLKPMMKMIAVLFIIFYFFALVGMKMFGGRILKNGEGIKDTPSMYYVNNFNDLFSSLVTLFSIMVVNNWFMTVNMCAGARSDLNVVSVRMFFIIFWYFSVIIGINLIVAFVLDSYDYVKTLEEERKKHLKDRLITNL